MNNLIKICVIFIFCKTIISPPVRKTPENKSLFNDLHYKSYLEEIVKELESDEKFAEVIKSAQEHNKTEHIANSLVFVNHHIRNKLDEIKRKEIERLNLLEKELERRKLESQGVKVPPPSKNFQKILSTDKDHIDHSNPHSFEMADLEKLIRKAEEDLQLVDREQEEVYKEHEMKKEYLKNKKLESVHDPKEREKIAKQFEDSEKRHDKHDKVHQPGNEEQLKEVWEKSDNLDPKEFSPKAFFDIHDINSDGHLDINEVESLMQNELTKVYEVNNTDDDIQERYHEMMRMRQEMMKRIDKNGDNLVSKEEFISYSSSPDFKDDSDWKTQEELDQKPYSDQEYKDFSDTFQDDDEDDFSDLEESLRIYPREFITPAPVTPEHKVDNPPNTPPKL